MVWRDLPDQQEERVRRRCLALFSSDEKVPGIRTGIAFKGPCSVACPGNEDHSQSTFR